jgi:two-component system, NarL family, nitrate/nitrite response regulator NarL
MREPVSTVIVDRGAIFRDGLARILSRSRFRVVGKYASIAEIAEHPEGVAGYVAENRTLLFVVGLLSHSDTPDLCWIKQQCPTSHLVLLFDREGAQTISVALRCGADACLQNTIDPDALMKALEVVMLGTFVISFVPGAHIEETSSIQELTLGSARAQTSEQASGVLSSREAEVLACIAEGGSKKSIARKFDITEAMVKVHVKAILRKLKAKNRTQAAISASRIADKPGNKKPRSVEAGPGSRWLR